MSNNTSDNKRRSVSRRIAMIAVYVALAFIFSYIEAIFPFSLGIPGVKLGLANIITVYVLFSTGSIKDTCLVTFLRIILAAFTFGNLSLMMYSMAGGVLSLLVMILFYKLNTFGITGVSVLGGVSHNIGQLIVAAIILETKEIVYYIPVLLIAGVIAGLVVGAIAGICVRRIHPKANKKI